MEENKKPQNPAAFPILDPNGSYYNEGMSLRDYFAAKAMQGMISNGTNLIDFIHHGDVAFAYKVADAMLKQREK